MLQTHVDACDSCQEIATAWKEMQERFAIAGVVSPESGFSKRWQQRFEETKEINTRKGGWWLFCIYVGVGILSISSLYYVVSSASISLLDIALEVLGDVSRILLLSGTAFHVIEKLFVSFTQLIPPAGWITVGTTLFALAVFWMVKIYQFAQPQGVYYETN